MFSLTTSLYKWCVVGGAAQTLSSLLGAPWLYWGMLTGRDAWFVLPYEMTEVGADGCFVLAVSLLVMSLSTLVWSLLRTFGIFGSSVRFFHCSSNDGACRAKSVGMSSDMSFDGWTKKSVGLVFVALATISAVFCSDLLYLHLRAATAWSVKNLMFGKVSGMDE